MQKTENENCAAEIDRPSESSFNHLFRQFLGKYSTGDMEKNFDE